MLVFQILMEISRVLLKIAYTGPNFVSVDIQAKLIL